MTLNDLEPHNGRYFALFHLILVSLLLITSHWLKLDAYCPRPKCSPRNLLFDNEIMMTFSVILSSSGPFSAQWAADFANVHDRLLVPLPRSISWLLLHVGRHKMLIATSSLAYLVFFYHRLVSSLLHYELGVLAPSGGRVWQTGISSLLRCHAAASVQFVSIRVYWVILITDKYRQQDGQIPTDHNRQNTEKC